MRLTLAAWMRLLPKSPSEHGMSLPDLEAVPVVGLSSEVPDDDRPTFSREQAKQILHSDASLFRSLHAPAVVGFHLVEQALSAVGTYQLLEASQNAVRGTNPMPAFFQFMLATFCLPPLVQSAGQVLEQMWRNAALSHYDNAFVSHDFARPALWAMNKGASDARNPLTSENQKNIRSAAFEANLRWGVDNEVTAFCKVSKLAMSTAVNMGLFAVTMGAQASFALGASTVGAMLFARHTSNQTTEQSRQSEAASNDMYAHKTLIWDNVVLGNANNAQRWLERYNALDSRERRAKSAVAVDQAIRQLKMFAITAAPVGAVLLTHGAQLARSRDTTALVRDLVLQMPRLVGTVGQLSSFADAWWSGFSARRRSLTRTLSTLRSTPALNLSEHMQPDRILIRQSGAPERWADVSEDITALATGGASGCYTISGVNGAGKSMAMLALQAQLGPHHSMLVPASLGHLDWRGVDGSTGQRNFAACEQALRFGPRVLILDEPHANLDSSNRRRLDAAIARSVEAHNRLVFVISHQVAQPEDADRPSVQAAPQSPKA